MGAEAVTGGLAGLFRGLEQGLLIKNQLKNEAADRAIAAADRELMLQDREMRQRQFEIDMKRAGLDLEEAEWQKQYRLANGEPEDIVEREHNERLMKIQNDLEERALRMQKLRSEIEENEAQAASYRARAAGGGKGPKYDESYEEGIKFIDEQMKVNQRIIDDPKASDEQKNAAAIQNQQLYGQREILYNSAMAERGLPMDKFAIGQTPNQENTTESPQENRDLLIRSLNPQPQGPAMAGEIRLPAGSSLNPIKGLGGLYSSLFGIAKEMPNPLAPVASIPNTNQKVTLNRMTPELIERMRAAGILPPEQNRPHKRDAGLLGIPLGQ